MDLVSGETRTLRRTMRDLVALSALPAIWAGYRPLEVAESLADVLLSTLRLDLVYLRLHGQTDGQGIEVARTVGGPTPTDQTQDIGRALAPWLDGAGIDSVTPLPNPVESGTVRVVIVPIGCGGRQDGVVVAGSRQAVFPNEEDLLLLRVAANQAAVVFQRERDEQALRESNERFRIVAKATNDAVWDWDLNTNKVWWNEGVLTLFGYRLENDDADPAWWLDRIHPEDRAAVESFFFEVVRGTELTWVDEYRLRCADGSYKDVYDRGYVLRGADGQAVRMIGAMLDITARKRAEEALQESEARTRAILETAVDAILTIDERGIVESVNPATERLFGYPAAELVGRNVKVLMPPPYREEHDAYLDNYLSTGQKKIIGVGREVVGRRKDGTTFPMDLAVSEVHLGDRRLFTGIARDISERKRAEEALRDSEYRWRSLTESLPQLVWTTTPDGHADYFSTQWTQYTGLPSDSRGWGWLEVLHPDDRDRTQQAWRAAVVGSSDYEIEHRIRRFDGTYRWFKTRGVAMRDNEGNVYKWLGTCTDITTDKQLEEELRLATERLVLAVRGSNICIWENDMPDGDPRHGRPYTLNYWEQLGYERPDLAPDYETSMSSIHPDDLPPVEEAIRSYLAGETSKFEVEYRVRHKDGSYRWMLVRGVAVRDAAGKPIRFMGSGVNFTDRKRLEEELRRAKEAAEAANRAKDEFLANVSHEVRTPMTAILGMTELALDTPLTEDQWQFLTTVKSAADNLLGLLNDLLDFSKIEAGKMELAPDDFSLRAVVGDTLRSLAVRAHTKGLELIYQVQPDMPDALVGDAGRLRQVLLNLVGNAIKFTERGEVVVEVQNLTAENAASAEGDKDLVSSSALATSSAVRLVFTVRDTGIGIPKDQQARIFRAFEQEDTSTTRKYGGTGLGLTIAARLVALMGGQITVESAPGRGSTFAFTARLGLQPRRPAVTGPPALLRGLRVLVVDDNATTRRVLEEWLRGWQMESQAVGDGLAAMGALCQGVSSGQPHALVLLDARMPDTDGLALAAKVRAWAELSPIRIILLTAGDRPGEAARARALRIDAHLLKPVQQDELLDTIYQVMSRADDRVASGEWRVASKDVGPSPLATRHAPLATPLRVLVAEDNEFNAQLMEHLLARRGYRARLAGTGREALALAADGAFDLLLLDVHMPELDGFQVVQAVRERERVAGGHLPIIALTARTRQEDRARCLAAGMDDFLAKPVQAADLWAAIDRVLRKDEGGRMKEEQDKTSAAASTFIPHPSSLGESLLDPHVLWAACGGEAAILEKICQAFRARLPDDVAAVQDALRERDAPRLRKAAHKLCGMVAAFSPGAAGVASDLEDQAAQGRLEEAQPLVGQLETLVPELLRVVGELSVDALRNQAGATAEPHTTAGP